jgi:hypothetical protein
MLDEFELQTQPSLSMLQICTQETQQALQIEGGIYPSFE